MTLESSHLPPIVRRWARFELINRVQSQVNEVTAQTFTLAVPRQDMLLEDEVINDGLPPITPIHLYARLVVLP